MSATLQDDARMGAYNAAREAIPVRETVTSYFYEEGAVSQATSFAIDYTLHNQRLFEEPRTLQ